MNKSTWTELILKVKIFVLNLARTHRVFHFEGWKRKVIREALWKSQSLVGEESGGALYARTVIQNKSNSFRNYILSKNER